MQSVFIKSGNRVFNREQICSFYFEKYEKSGNVLHIRTTDGHKMEFQGQAADILWDMLSDASLDFTPKSGVADE